MAFSTLRTSLYRLLEQAARAPIVARSRNLSNFSIYRHVDFSAVPTSDFPQSSRPTSHFSYFRYGSPVFHRKFCTEPSAEVVYELLAQVEAEKRKDRDERRRKGEEVDSDEEDKEDFCGVGTVIERLEKKKDPGEVWGWDEPTDSENEEEDDRNSPAAVQKRQKLFDKKFERHEGLLKDLLKSETFDEAFALMDKINKFEEQHFPIPIEYRVIGEMMERLKEATGKDRFLLLMKLHRAVKLVEWKEANDPNNPSNFGEIKHRTVGSSADLLLHSGTEKEMQMIRAARDDEDETDDFEVDKNAVLLERIKAIDQQLEEKLSALDRTFGKKGRALEEEVRFLAEERNAMIQKQRTPLYRKGFDVKVVNINRTCKMTKGGRQLRVSVTLVCGNYNGIIGFARGKGPNVPLAGQKAYEKCFQNLHYMERFEEHTIAHAVQANFKKSKVYLWPARTVTGLKAGKVVETVLILAGYKNVKSKVIGSRNPYNTLKAVFKALNAIETPKDIQEKFGRTVVETRLL